MRRVVFGIVSFAIGLAVLSWWGNRYLAIGAALGSYALADRLGLIPSVYEPRHHLLHHDDESHES